MTHTLKETATIITARGRPLPRAVVVIATLRGALLLLLPKTKPAARTLRIRVGCRSKTFVGGVTYKS
jgi:hypothetical protein